MKITSYILVLCLLILNLQASATHNRAGEITFEQTGPLTFEVIVTTYTKISGASSAADRDSLGFCWGDGICEWVERNDSVLIGDDIQRNRYIQSHMYPFRSTYVISMEDPNRNGGILNVNPPNSDQVPFRIETVLTIPDSGFEGYNNSPIFLNPPIDMGVTNEVFIHSPNAFDVDGDSIAYELITPSGVSNYSFPDAFGGSISLNEMTGEFIWDSPQQIGEYAIAILVKEYRNGVLLSRTIRDMQVLIGNGFAPPDIDVNELEIQTVTAGGLIEFEVMANSDLAITLSATGGPFETEFSPAFFEIEPERSASQTGTFTWETTCEHARTEPYQVVFWSQDEAGITSSKTLRFQVNAPAPENLVSTERADGVLLEWDAPYVCEYEGMNRFRGFSVWKRSVWNQSFIQIASDITDVDMNGNFSYLDESLDLEVQFYITADFAYLSPANQPYNIVHSIPSNEVYYGLADDVTEASSLQNNIKIYPTLVDNEVQIAFDFEESQKNLTVKVSDVTGRVIQQKEHTNIQQELLMLDVSAQTAGLYFVQIQTDKGQIFTQKIIIK